MKVLVHGDMSKWLRLYQGEMSIPMRFTALIRLVDIQDVRLEGRQGPDHGNLRSLCSFL